MNKVEISIRCPFKDRYVLILFYVQICVSQGPAGLPLCKKCFKKEPMFSELLHVPKGHGYPKKSSGTLARATRPPKKDKPTNLNAKSYDGSKKNKIR